MADEKDTVADVQIRKIKNHPLGSKLVVLAFVAGSLTALVAGWQKIGEFFFPPASQNNAEQPATPPFAPDDKNKSSTSRTGSMREPTELIRTIASDNVKYPCSVFYAFPEPRRNPDIFRIERDRLAEPAGAPIAVYTRDEADIFDSDIPSDPATGFAATTGFAVSVRAPRGTYAVGFLTQLSTTNPNNGKPQYMASSKRGVEIVPGNEYMAAFPPEPRGGDLFVKRLSAAEARDIRTQLGVDEASCK